MSLAGVDPLQTRSGAHIFWTTVNAAEAMPGVVTPLTWTFYAPAVEIGVRGAFHDLGILRRNEVSYSPVPDERLMGIFHGRAAFNLNIFRDMADRAPGQSGDAVEEQFFGTVRPGITSTPVRRRYPVVLAKAPRAASRIRTTLPTLKNEAHERWTRAVGADGLRRPDDAGQHLREVNALVQRIFRAHGLGAQVAPAIVERLATLAEQAGHPGLELRLLSGTEDLHESRMLTDMWSASRGRTSVDAVLAEHGYHGPNEGELAARSWREKREPLLALLAKYEALPESDGPAAVRARRMADMASAEKDLLGALSPARRRQARLLLRLARCYVPLREVGRSAFIQGIDIARAATRAIGGRLVDDGHLDEPDDVLFLTYDEVRAAQPPAGSRDLVKYRRDRFDEYRTQRLPDSWMGQPEPITVAAEPAAGTGPLTLTGLAVAPGIVEGTARVITDASEDTLEDGEILVCPVTNPSWASLFLIAGAVVIDTGGPLSHGAIVARELGLPCVINTRTGTHVLRTGDRLRVNGFAGTVERL